MYKSILRFGILAIFTHSIYAYDSETLVDTNNNSTSTSTVTSTNTNNNTNVNTNDTTVNSTSTNTSNNTNINTSTSTNTSTSVNTNTSTSTNNNVNTNNSTSENTNYNYGEMTTNVNNNSVNQNNVTSDNKNTNINQNVNESNQTVNSRNFNDNDSNIKQKIESPPPTAVAPSMMSGGNNDLCTTGVSGALQTQILGISGGGTIRDLNCERLKLSKYLYDMGMKVAAVSTLCQDRRVFDAMMNAGTPCPIDGLIGEKAKIAWVKNEKLIPEPIKEKTNDKIKSSIIGTIFGVVLSVFIF